jgi:hypothetical protein
VTASLARSDIQRLRDLADSWRQARRSAWFADGLHLTLDAIEARRAEGGDVFCAEVSGNSVPELHDRALLKAADLWGLDAAVMVEKTGTVHETLYTDRGRYHASVTLRCLNYGEIST